MNGCVYQYNAHEQYASPGIGQVCGAQTYAATDASGALRDDTDPYCPTHGGTAAPADATPDEVIA